MILDNVRRLCKANGISLSKLEHELGFGNSTIAKWETTSPRIDSLQKVATYFGVSVDALLAKEE